MNWSSKRFFSGSIFPSPLAKQHNNRQSRGRANVQVEALESRLLLATFFTVGFDDPEAAPSLRSAIVAANKPIEVAGGTALHLNVGLLNFGNKNVLVNSFILDFNVTGGATANHWVPLASSFPQSAGAENHTTSVRDPKQAP